MLVLAEDAGGASLEALNQDALLEAGAFNYKNK